MRRPQYRRFQMEDAAVLPPTSPALSMQQYQNYTKQLEATQHNSFVGCTYMGLQKGIQCKNSYGLPDYKPNAQSYAGAWARNIYSDFPVPNITRGGGLDQIMAGGGPDAGACAQNCSCVASPDCACTNFPDCGYHSINQTCVGPTKQGTYASLTECEDAVHSGRVAAPR